MIYQSPAEAVLIRRVNRFIAEVVLDGTAIRAHVPNTGRCAELLLPGSRVILDRAAAPGRKTAWDLVSVYKGPELFNIDSRTPNRIAAENMAALFPGVERWRGEAVSGDSRLDFYLDFPDREGYLEAKGVTLEDGGIFYFPDAPTMRGTKHLKRLTALAETGVGAAVLFVAQAGCAEGFRPNIKNDPLFAEALLEAAGAGVDIRCVRCLVTPGSVTLAREIPCLL